MDMRSWNSPASPAPTTPRDVASPNGNRSTRRTSNRHLLVWYTGAMSILLVLHTGHQSTKWSRNNSTMDHYFEDLVSHSHSSITSADTGSSSTADPSQMHGPLGWPAGRAKAQSPSFNEEKETSSSVYNADVVSPSVWKHLIKYYNVRSVVDVASCGVSAAWFATHGVASNLTCVDKNIQQSLLQHHGNRIQHDFTKGPWWPDETVDLVWASDFVDRVPLQYQHNYISTFRKAALIVVSVTPPSDWTSTSGLVEAHSDDEWWVRKFALYGFQQHPAMTQELRSLAQKEALSNDLAPDGEPYNAKHLQNSLHVFINPVVASLPEHSHLLAQPACPVEKRKKDGTWVMLDCTGTEQRFRSLPLYKRMDHEWETQVKSFFHYSNSNSTSLLSQHHPLLQWYRKEIDQSQLPVMPVVVWPLLELGIGNAESLHIEQNGVNESSVLSLVDTMTANNDPNAIWVGDTGYGFGFKPWCIEYHKRIRKERMRRKRQGLPTEWPVFIVDFTDAAEVYQKCPQIEAELGQEFVKYAKRSFVTGRHFDAEDKWVHSGRLMNQTYRNTTYQHSPLVVRTDTISSLKHVLDHKYHLPLNASIEELERTVDVSHFWPTNGQRVGQVKSQLRHHVSETIESMRDAYNLTAFVGLAGDAVRTGRRGVKSAYIEAMLDTKIIVVTQRDGWEDHYRLFEALVSGALVITDRMLSLPHGLKNGTSILEVTGTDDLKQKILYYLKHPAERLEIARRGRLVAMTSHRTWHRIEEIVFGTPLTKCSEPDSKVPCPFVVHGEEVVKHRYLRGRRRT